ncbi:MAG TPA: sialate O-acetylesterase, partial [Sphingobacteriaceae bacterium]
STPGAKIKGIIWNQGEGDNNEASGSQYLERLNKLVTDLRTDLGDQNIPFIAGEVGKWNNRGLFVNPEIRKIKNSISNSDWVSSDGFTSINQTKNDPHFDILSTRALGGRYADKAAELIYHVKPAGITVFNDTDFKGRSVLLVEGNYSKSDLEKQGILMSEIASMKADKEYELFLNLANAKEIMITNNSKMNLTDVQLLSVKKRKH